MAELYDKFLTIGERQGLTDNALLQYVDEKVKASEEREDRLRDRETEKMSKELVIREKEMELEREKMDKETEKRDKESENREREMEHELAMAQLQPSNAGHSKTNIRLTPYNVNENIATYCSNFERIKKANGWNDSVGLSALFNAFSGTPVSKFLSSLDSDLTYDQIKPKLIRVFGFTSYALIEKFNSVSQGSENFSQFLENLRSDLTQFCELTGVIDDYKSLFEKMIVIRLLQAVPVSLSEYLKEHDCFKLPLDKIIDLAENFQAIHKVKSKSASSDRPMFSGKSFSVTKDTNVSLPNSSLRPSRPRVTCSFCKKTGHVEDACWRRFPEKKPKNLITKRTVHNVSSVNLASSFDQTLPVAYGECNGKRVKVLRDSGATLVLCNTKLVQNNKFLNETVKLRFADGSIKQAPLTTIRLNCPFYSGSVTAACVQDLPFDVLVGNVPGALCPCSVNKWITSPEELCNAVTRQNTKNPINKTTIKLKSEVEIDLNKINSQELIALQRQDPELVRLFAIAEKPSTNSPKYSLENGVLTRRIPASHSTSEQLKQIVLPKNLRIKVLKIAHDSVFAGHLGIKKTQDRVLRHFFWPGIYGEIQRYCRSCPICQKMLNVKPAKAPLINLPVINSPFKRVAVDLIGPMPLSRRGNRYALVYLDLATKYPDAVPLKNIDTESVALALMDIFSRVGLPSEILHDRGTQFMSSVMARFNELLKIKSIQTAAYNPKCNGSVENFNKTLKSMLKKISVDDPRNWDIFLQPLLFAYREVPQASTGFSPFELLFGHEVRGPLYLIKEQILNLNQNAEEASMTEYVMSMRDKIRDYMQAANESESIAKRKQKRYYDKATRNRTLNVGDEVLLLLPTSHTKLLAEWKGPYTIVRKFNKVDYVVKVGKFEHTYHINMLKLFKRRPAQLVNLIHSDDDIITSVLPDTNISSVSDCIIDQHLDPKQSKSIFKILKNNKKVFNDAPGKISGQQYTIQVNPKTKPIASKPYRVPFHLKLKVKEELEEWLSLGIIRKSTSPWTSPVVVVANKDNSIRITIDYRKLNTHIQTDNFPMPSVDSVIEDLQSAKYMTKIDLTKSFFQMPLDSESIKYTSFVTDAGQFEFTVVPFGIKFATGLMNRTVNAILQKLDQSDGKFVSNFVDDLIIYSDSFEQHERHIDKVLRLFLENGIKLRAKKCNFAATSLTFLGFVVGNGQVKPDESKIQAIVDFPKPVTKSDLRSFLGLINFYMRFAPALAEHTSVLNYMLSQYSPDTLDWKWNCSQSFQNAKDCMSHAVNLYIPKQGGTFILQTDACKFGIAAVLWQDINQVQRPIVFISRKLNSAEQNYATIEQECLAIKWAILKLHDYLYGKLFIVKTDHAPLQWLMNLKDRSSRRMRWSLQLQPYDFSITYIRGRDNLLADVLSRHIM